MIYVGLDPSFKRTGIAIYTNSVFILTRYEPRKVFDKNFQGVFYAIDDVVQHVLQEIPTYEEVAIISECAPPSGSFASGLYALDVTLFREIRKLPCLKSLYLVYPNYLQHLHKKRKYQKSESVSLCKSFAKIRNLTLPEGRHAHDEYEACLFLYRLLVREGVLEPPTSTKFTGFFDEKEHQLF